jgi:hypothetical protein
MLFQDWRNNGGGGTRSGASSSIMGMYVNEDPIGKYHRIKMKVDNNGDDIWELDSTSYPVVKVTEFIPIAGVSNPNIRLGNGNISCGNISCSSLTITDLTIDNVITNYNVNVGGDMITVGFPMSGAIASKSIVRLAGANTVLNYGDLSWDGTTFNLSTRQANKNFKVSFGQQDYFEVNSNNTSCRSLYVNGNLSMSGTLTVGGTLNFTNAIVQNSLLVNGLITASDAVFSNDVTFVDNVSMHKRLNVSNLSVTQGLTVYGNISTRGNISANSIYAPNLSTASLRPGTNITIVDGFINAYVEGGTLVDCGSLLVDTNANIFGILNVSETSTFSESLNVCNILYAGKTGQHDGSVVLYSQTIGNNWASKYDGTILNMSATGGSSAVNIWLGDNKMLSITPNGVNICGTLKADAIDADYENFSTTNLSVAHEITIGTPSGGQDSIFTMYSADAGENMVMSHTSPSEFTFKLSNEDESINFNCDTTNVLKLTRTGSTMTGNLNISGILTADNITGVDFQNISNTNLSSQSITADDALIGFINVSLLEASVLNTSTFSSQVLNCSRIVIDEPYPNYGLSVNYINCSNIFIDDTTGGGGLIVNSGVVTFPALILNKEINVYGDDSFIGEPYGTGKNSRISFWVPGEETKLGLMFGVYEDKVGRIELLYNENQFNMSTFNIKILNTSTMTMTNASTTFHQGMNVNGQTNVCNISGTNASFTSLTATNISTGSLIFGNGLNYNFGVLSVNFTQFEITVAELDTALKANVSTDNLVAGLGIIDVLTVTTFLQTPEANVSVVNCSDIDSNSGTIDVLDSTNLSTVNLSADIISTDQLDVNTSVNARYLNSSSLKTLALNVSGLTKLDSLSVSGPGATSFVVDEVSIGKLTGTGSRSVVTFWAPTTPNEVGFRMGLDGDGVARLAIPYYGQFMTFNINISNVSYLTMKNNSTRFERPVIFGSDVTATKITSTNVCNTNLSTVNCTITTLRGTTLNGTTINASNLNISTKLTVTNISGTNATFTSLTASNVQPTLTASTGITIENNVISLTGGGGSYTEGDNIQIVDNVISTRPNINVSNISAINGSFTNLTCSGNISFSIGDLLYRDVFSGILNVSELKLTNTLIDPLKISFKSQLINTSKLNVSNISLVAGLGGGVIDMGGLGQITKLGILTGATLNASQINSSTINAPNISSNRANFTTDIITPKLTVTTLNTSSTILFKIDNFTYGEFAEEAFILYNPLISPVIQSTQNICGNNGSFTNLSSSTITATSIVAPNVQPTLTGSNGITIENNVISLTGGGGSYTAGDNIQIVDNVISTKPNINVSNLSSINCSFTNISSTRINANIVTGILINTSDINCSTKISCTNLSVFTQLSAPTGKLTTVNSTTLNGLTVNGSNLNASTKLTAPNISANRASFTTDITTPKVTTEALNTSSTMTFNILNVPSVELSDALYLYTDLRGTNLYSSENICGNNGSMTNVSCVNLTGTSLLSVNISASNVSVSGDLTMSGYIDRKNHFIRRFRLNNETLISSSYQVIYGSVGYGNDDLVTANSTSNTFTIVKPGRYKISTIVLFDNGSYTDRINWRVTLYKNSAASAALGQAFCYTRHRDYAEYGSAYHSSIQDFAVDDTFHYIVDCNRASATGFNSTMSGSFVLNGTCLEIEYLG